MKGAGGSGEFRGREKLLMGFSSSATSATTCLRKSNWSLKSEPGVLIPQVLTTHYKEIWGEMMFSSTEPKQFLKYMNYKRPV